MSINLGNIFQQNGKTVFGGTASGLDTQGTIDALVEARSISVTTLEDKVDLNTEKIAAFEEFQTLLDNFASATNFLRNPPGIGNDDEDIFAYRDVSLSSNTAISPNVYVDVLAEPGTSEQEYEISVTQVATRRSILSASLAFAADDPFVTAGPVFGQFQAGTLDINNGVTVELEVGDSLNELVAKVNSVKEQSGVEATLIQAAPNEYRLQFSSLEPGVSNDFFLNSNNNGPGEPMEAISIPNYVSAQDSIFEINGIQVTRGSNVIDDAISGLTFTLNEETPPGTLVTAKIESDTDLIVDGVTNFINTYNEIRVFVARQNERDDSGLPVEGAVLAGNTTLTSAMSRIDAELNQVIENLTSGDPQSLADIGITYTDFEGDAETPEVRNVLTLDSAALRSELEANPNAVSRVFGMNFQADSPELLIYASSNTATPGDYSLVVDTIAETATVTYDDGSGPQVIEMDYEAYTGSISLTGQEGTVLEGLELVYSDTVDATFNFSFSQGVADAIYNVVDELSDPIGGVVATETTNLTEANERFGEDITSLEEEIERFRQRLLERFSALEQAIAQANNVIQLLEANSAAREAN